MSEQDEGIRAAIYGRGGDVDGHCGGSADPSHQACGVWWRCGCGRDLVALPREKAAAGSASDERFLSSESLSCNLSSATMMPTRSAAMSGEMDGGEKAPTEGAAQTGLLCRGRYAGPLRPPMMVP